MPNSGAGCQYLLEASQEGPARSQASAITTQSPCHRGHCSPSPLMISRLATPSPLAGGVLASSCQNAAAIRGRCITLAAPVVERDTGAAPPAAVDFIRPHLRQLSAYTPIEPFEVLSARLGRRPEDIIKLDANENPYGPPQAVRDALASMPFPHIYPDPESRRLREALSAVNGVPIENLLVGCGADELIDLLMRCVLDPGDSIVDCPPTFTMYVFDAAVNNARVVTVPRLDKFRLDVAGIRDAVALHGPKILFLTSPNNPDGSMIAEQDLRDLLQLPVLVVLDEAYIEFSDVPSRMTWVLKHPNLVVLRTFSKSAALAGIRVGYGAFPDELIKYMWRAKQPYNVSVASETAACAALTDTTYMREVREALVTERERLYEGLQSIPFLEPYPSHSNFVLSLVKGLDAKGIKDRLAQEHGIIIRHYSKPELSKYIRISVGKPEHTDAVLQALRAMQ